jgi:hypothetical protein
MRVATSDRTGGEQATGFAGFKGSANGVLRRLAASLLTQLKTGTSAVALAGMRQSSSVLAKAAYG